MCVSTRYVLIAGVVGVLAATLSGSDTIGWIAAGVAALITFLAARSFPGRVGRASCALPARTAPTPHAEREEPPLEGPAPPADRRSGAGR